MACCAPIVLSWSGSSNLAGFPLSLADASVDPFPQQVGVAAVTGVLLDHVDKHFAQRDGVSVSHSPGGAEVGGAGNELLREGDLVAPGLLQSLKGLGLASRAVWGRGSARPGRGTRR